MKPVNVAAPLARAAAGHHDQALEAGDRAGRKGRRYIHKETHILNGFDLEGSLKQ